MQYGLHGYKRSRMKRSKIWQEIELELRLDKKKTPSFPDHAAGMAGRVIVPAGNLMFHSMEYKYSSDVTDEKNAKKMKEAAIQTAVQAIRFLENLK